MPRMRHLAIAAFVAALQIVPAHAQVTLHSFTGVPASPASPGNPGNPVDGNYPWFNAPVTYAQTDKGRFLFGTTWEGGDTGPGAVFRVDLSNNNAESLLWSFKGAANGDGGYPAGELIYQSNPEAIYGTTVYGASAGPRADACTNQQQQNGCGTVFMLTPVGGAWRETILYTFGGAANGDGSGPSGALVSIGGAFYGTTREGGQYPAGQPIPCGGDGCGTVFMLTPHNPPPWIETVLYSFKGPMPNAFNVRDGAHPWAGVISDNGSLPLYGSTTQGGVGSCLNNATSGLGGSSGCGTVFELTKGAPWHETVLHFFTGGADGSNPAGVVFGPANGPPLLYGTAGTGGLLPGVGKLPPHPCGIGASPTTPSYGCGVVFELTRGIFRGKIIWPETVLYTFMGGSDGFFPDGGVIFKPACRIAPCPLYGTTDGGGNAVAANGTGTRCYDTGLNGAAVVNTMGCGTLFTLTPAGPPWNKAQVNFAGTNGDGPLAPLIFENGVFYGTTVIGGVPLPGGFKRSCVTVSGTIFSCGTVFSWE